MIATLEVRDEHQDYRIDYRPVPRPTSTRAQAATALRRSSRQRHATGARHSNRGKSKLGQNGPHRRRDKRNWL